MPTMIVIRGFNTVRELHHETMRKVDRNFK
jgi:hypothetical protein